MSEPTRGITIASAGKRDKVAGPLLNWYRNHPGIARHAGEVAAALGLNPHSGLTAAANLAKDGLLERTVPRGNYVCRVPAASANGKLIPVGALLECVGHTANGEAVIKDEEDVVYIAKIIG